MGYEAPQITSIGNMIAAGLGVSIVPISIVGSFLGTFCLSKDRLCFWQKHLAGVRQLDPRGTRIEPRPCASNAPFGMPRVS
jgi:hypothetical protein